MKSYKDAGVDIEAGYESVKLMRKHVKKTFRPEVLTDIGKFGGLFSLGKFNFKEPVLVSGTDGVGTKLKIAFKMNRHDSIGIDCVAMCVNDVVCSGAEPLFFLDYIATGKNEPEKISDIVKGVADGCCQAGCALIGGETAEMPDFYNINEYDIAGFAVGIVEKSEIIDGCNIKEKDKVIGLLSSGIHSNGFSLVRKILKTTGQKLTKYIKEFGTDLGTELLKPTRIYVKTILDLKQNFRIKGISNITGGGFYENIPRMVPKGLRVRIDSNSWQIPQLFKFLQNTGNIDRRDMFNIFNMGIGMVIVVDETAADSVVKYLTENNVGAYVIGEIIKGRSGVELC